MARWRNGLGIGLAINRSWVLILLGAKLHNNLGQVVHTYVPRKRRYTNVRSCSLKKCEMATLTERNDNEHHRELLTLSLVVRMDNL